MYQKFKNWYKHNGLCTKKAIFGTRLSLCIFCTSSNGRRNMAQIKKDTSLRKAILQAAVTGRLVSAVEGETETGRQLLDRIIEERNAKLLAEWEESLKTNPKAKKPAPVAASKINEDEIPFEIPENWCWCRIDDLFSHNTGKALNKSENKEGKELEYITTSNLYWNYFELNNLKTMLFKDSEIEKCTVRKGDLLVCEGGEVGRTAIWTFDREICIQNHIHRLRAYEPSLNKKFYYYVMFLYKEGKVIDAYAKGIGIKGLSSNALGSIIVPLPPLVVQNAIAAKLEQVLPLVDSYENALLQKEELKGALKDNVKKAVLQEAVQGKLVPQIAGEGNAKDLLAEIKKNRTDLQISTKSAGKKSAAKKELPPITEEEIPFEIPENWYWCRITDIATCELGKTKDSQKNTGNLKDYLCSINIQEDGIDLTKVKQMRFEDSEFERYTVRKNDLLICEGGDAGRCAIYDKDEPMYYQNALHRVRFFNNISTKFYLYIFQLYKANKILLEASKGVTIQHLTGASLKELCFPLPPLAEQKRIVAAVEELLPLCERLGR